MTTVATQAYRYIVHEASEGGYWAEVVGLPGCVSQGETLEELQANIREAIEAVLMEQPRIGPFDLRIEPTLPEKDTVVLSADTQTGTVGGPAETKSTWTFAA